MDEATLSTIGQLIVFGGVVAGFVGTIIKDRKAAKAKADEDADKLKDAEIKAAKAIAETEQIKAESKLAEGSASMAVAEAAHTAAKASQQAVEIQQGVIDRLVKKVATLEEKVATQFVRIGHLSDAVVMKEQLRIDLEHLNTRHAAKEKDQESVIYNLTQRVLVVENDRDAIRKQRDDAERMIRQSSSGNGTERKRSD